MSGLSGCLRVYQVCVIAGSMMIVFLMEPAVGLCALAVVAAALGGSFVSSARRSGWWELRFHRGPERFLCPRCLNFGPFALACPECRGHGSALEVGLDDGLLPEARLRCPKCGIHPLEARPGESGLPQGGYDGLAYCRHCGHVCPRTPFHRRRVRVVGVLLGEDFAAALSPGSKAPEEGSGILCTRRDDGEWLTWLLDLSSVPNTPYPVEETHALRFLDALWVAGPTPDLLELGESSDRLLRRLGLAEGRAEKIGVCVSAADLAPAARSLLESRFGSIQLGVTAEGLLGAPLPQPAGRRTARESTGHRRRTPRTKR